jgi:ABC-type uncharacterized transport system, auxiliary component
MKRTIKPFTFGAARLAFAGAVCLSLTGCLSIGGKTPDQLLRLTPDESAPAGATSSGAIADAIMVMDPEADRSLDMLRVPVRVDASSLAYLKDATWIEKPTRLFRSLLAETIRSRTDRLVIEGGDFEIAGKTRVGGRLLQMGYDAQSSSVIVRFDAVIGQGGPGTDLRTRRFESVISGIEPEAAYVGPAINRAANDVARQVADWVKAG